LCDCGCWAGRGSGSFSGRGRSRSSRFNEVIETIFLIDGDYIGNSRNIFEPKCRRRRVRSERYIRHDIWKVRNLKVKFFLFFRLWIEWWRLGRWRRRGNIRGRRRKCGRFIWYRGRRSRRGRWRRRFNKCSQGRLRRRLRRRRRRRGFRLLRERRGRRRRRRRRRRLFSRKPALRWRRKRSLIRRRRLVGAASNFGRLIAGTNAGRGAFRRRRGGRRLGRGFRGGARQTIKSATSLPAALTGRCGRGRRGCRGFGRGGGDGESVEAAGLRRLRGFVGGRLRGRGKVFNENALAVSGSAGGFCFEAASRFLFERALFGCLERVAYQVGKGTRDAGDTRRVGGCFR
jgi:hypothetical protein